jgi:hypothetical protein
MEQFTLCNNEQILIEGKEEFLGLESVMMLSSSS